MKNMTNKSNKPNPTHKSYKTYARIALGVIAIGAVIAGFLAFNQPKVEKTERQMEHPELKIESLQEGTGTDTVEVGSTVSIHYISRLEDETVVASTYEKDAPFTFTVGDGNVIQAWEIGVEGMRVGEKRKITSPASLAYGEGGVRELVPPDAVIITEIEVLEIK